MYRYGLVSWRLPGDLFHAIELCWQCSVQSLQIDYGGPNRGPSLDTIDISIIRKSAESKKVKITALALNLFNDIGISSTNPFDINLCKSIFTNALFLAKKLECDTIFIPSFGKSIIISNIDIKHSANFLQWCCDQVHPDFIIASENILSVEHSRKLSNLVNRSNFKLLLDPANLFNASITSSYYFHELTDLICNQIHIKSPTNIALNKLHSDFFSDLNQLIMTPGFLSTEFIYFSENDYRFSDTSFIMSDINWIKKYFHSIKES
ncbi:hypothetical protein [Photorhabdus asymbiotica]|uniref:hypothetical protein n=1 Tax=Photorhabdus asymbiotica TaxID=291112 RepID=UPI003DA6D15B